MEDVDVWAALLPHSLLCDDVRRREVAGCVTPVVQSTNFLLLSTDTLAMVTPTGKSYVNVKNKEYHLMGCDVV
jgi:hypothetical protein